MKIKNKKIIAVFLLALTLVVGGCSKKESPKTDEKNTNGQEQKVDVNNDDKVEVKDEGKDQSKEEEKEEDKIVKQEDLTEKLKKESIVADGQVYFQGDYVIATILAKEGSKEDEVKKLADKYAQDLKKKYDDKKVNVQAISGGKNVATVILE